MYGCYLRLGEVYKIAWLVQSHTNLWNLYYAEDSSEYGSKRAESRLKAITMAFNNERILCYDQYTVWYQCVCDVLAHTKYMKPEMRIMSCRSREQHLRSHTINQEDTGKWSFLELLWRQADSVICSPPCVDSYQCIGNNEWCPHCNTDYWETQIELMNMGRASFTWRTTTECVSYHRAHSKIERVVHTGG